MTGSRTARRLTARRLSFVRSVSAGRPCPGQRRPGQRVDRIHHRKGQRRAGDDAERNLRAAQHHRPGTTPDERAAYLKAAAQKRRAAGEEAEALPAAPEEDEEAVAGDTTLAADRFEALEGAEEMILTVTDGGFGKRSSAYEYRVTGRGGQGITNIALGARNGREVVATIPVRDSDDVMLVTDGGQLIRLPARQVRLTGRQAMGVTLLRLSGGERVTSCFPVADEQGQDPPSAGIDPLETPDAPPTAEP